MTYLIFLGQLLLSALLGGVVGWQREHVGKAAGSRTYALVSLGSTLFTLLSIRAFGSDDAARVAAQILTGVGFLGAGTIIHKNNSLMHKSSGIEGLTTAAGLWAVAAVGMAVGAGWYFEAAIASGIMFVIFIVHVRD